MGYRVAVVGATGNVGREMLNILEEVEFPVDKIHAIACRAAARVLAREEGTRARVLTLRRRLRQGRRQGRRRHRSDGGATNLFKPSRRAAASGL